MGVILEHGSKDMDVRISSRVKNETGVGKWRTVARAVREEDSQEVVMEVEEVSNEMCMELPYITHISYFRCYAVHSCFFFGNSKPHHICGTSLFANLLSHASGAKTLYFNHNFFFNKEQ